MTLLELLAVILIVAWIGGFALNVGGSLIHLLLVAALALFVLRLFRRATI